MQVRPCSWLALLPLSLLISCGGHATAPALARASLEPSPSGAAKPPLTVPRLVAPLTGYAVSTHKPTFHVELPPGSEGAEIEVCRDRECSQVLARFAGASARIRSTAVLPETRLFYRARGRRDGQAVGPPSAAFQFMVRRGAPEVDTAFVAFSDANADGRDDERLFGAAQGFAFRVPESETGRGYFRVGDVNGDGFSDVLADAPCPDPSGCAENPVVLFLGGVEGFTKAHELERPRGEAPDPDGAPEFADAGDVDGDGYADVVAFFPNGGTYLYRGSAGGLRLPPQDLAARESTPAVLGGDLNGDGFTDIVIAEGRSAPPFEARVYFGGPGGPSSERTLSLRAPDDAAGFGAAVVARGDLNRDGFSDVVIGAASAPYPLGQAGSAAVPGQIYVFYGGTRASARPNAVLRGTDMDGALFGLGIGVGDFDGNGAADVVGVAPCAQRTRAGECQHGQAFLFEGSAAGIDRVPSAALSDPSTPSAQVVLVRDLDGDGFDDLSYAGSFYGGSSAGLSAAGSASVP